MSILLIAPPPPFVALYFPPFLKVEYQLVLQYVVPHGSPVGPKDEHDQWEIHFQRHWWMEHPLLPSNRFILAQTRAHRGKMTVCLSPSCFLRQQKLFESGIEFRANKNVWKEANSWSMILCKLWVELMAKIFWVIRVNKHTSGILSRKWRKHI